MSMPDGPFLTFLIVWGVLGLVPFIRRLYSPGGESDCASDVNKSLLIFIFCGPIAWAVLLICLGFIAVGKFWKWLAK